MKKIVIFSVAIIFGIGIGVFAKDYFIPTNTDVEVADVEQIFNLSVAYSDEKLDFYENLEFSEGETLFDATARILENEEIAFEFEDYGDLGVLVTSIGGQAGEDGSYWQYWVNGEYAQVGASSYEIQAGDSIEWKYADEQE